MMLYQKRVVFQNLLPNIPNETFKPIAPVYSCYMKNVMKYVVLGSNPCEGILTTKHDSVEAASMEIERRVAEFRGQITMGGPVEYSEMEK